MKNIQRHILSAMLLLASLSLFSSSVLAQDSDADQAFVLDGTPRVQLIMELSRIHEAPTIEQLRAIPLATSLEAALIAIADDGVALQLIRGRAINALAFEAGPETQRFVEGFLANNAESNLFLLGRTVRLVGSLSSKHPEWAIELLEPLIGHQDGGVREYVVISLGDVRRVEAFAPRVDASLTQLIIAERNPAVQDALRLVLDLKPALAPEGMAPIRRQGLER